MQTAQIIANHLLEKKAVQISTNPPFTLTSGMKAPIYCDNRLLISYPDARKAVVEGFQKLIETQKLEFDVIAGTATAAIPWAAFLAEAMTKPMTYVRPKAKGHGAGKQVEGTMKNGSKVLIVEDLFSTGGSSIKSAEACKREFDAQVVGAIAIFSYGFPVARESFERVGLKHFTLTNFPTLLEQIEDISKDEKNLVLDFAQDPQNWAEKNNL